MDLKEYVEKHLKDRAETLKTLTAQTRKASRLFEKADTQNSRYLVNLISLWADSGEKHTKTEYTGSLRDAIKKAEADFKRINDRTDVQAEYHVDVLIGGVSVVVPGEYWIKYKSRH